ncbi:nicotinate phosphoribosyltransferase [Lewinella sp. W8]|nr:nicotinate phosphoribosyltransferase [Lewinella sp. W8]
MLTDLYQLTMAAGYHRHRIHQRKAIFHLFYRKPPFGGQFALSAGLPLAVDLIENFRYGTEDVHYLGRLKGNDGKPIFRENFLNYLQRLRFGGNIDAIPEGEIVMPHEPILRIEATLAEAQLLETALLTIINFSTLVATKAARIREAAGEDSVLEFGLRRSQGIDGGLTATRSAYLGGCDATSNVWGGRYYGIPVKGTHAHSWVMIFREELEAFEAYAAAMPNNAILLVDTYDTLEGVQKAIQVAKHLRERGHHMLGIRLDSGDMARLSIDARRLLDEAGFPEVKIVASDSLDEYAIAKLKAQGARIDIWGIGTRLVTAHDQPALGGVYKLAAVENEAGEYEPRIKQSETAVKTSNPGKLNVRRYFTPEGQLAGSKLYNELNGPEAHQIVLSGEKTLDLSRYADNSSSLLQPVYRSGELVMDFPDLHEVRERGMRNWKKYSAVGNAGHPLSFGPAPALLAEQQRLMR